MYYIHFLIVFMCLLIARTLNWLTRGVWHIFKFAYKDARRHMTRCTKYARAAVEYMVDRMSLFVETHATETKKRHRRGHRGGRKHRKHRSH